VYSHPSAGAPVGVVYLTAINQGGSADRLVSVTADIATSAELHETIESDGRMKMKHHPVGFKIAPGSELSLAAGGKHIMLTGLTAKLEAGSTFNLELLFEQTGIVEIAVPIRPRSH
jgi:periplasmic copper chaperone A